MGIYATDDAWINSLLMQYLCTTCFYTAHKSLHQDIFCASKLLSAHIQLAQDLGEIGDAQEQIESGSMKSRCAGQFVCA